MSSNPGIQRAESSLDEKPDIERAEVVADPKLGTVQEDDDQVGYAAFKEAQERGYEPVRFSGAVWDPLLHLGRLTRPD